MKNKQGHTVSSSIGSVYKELVAAKFDVAGRLKMDPIDVSIYIEPMISFSSYVNLEVRIGVYFSKTDPKDSYHIKQNITEEQLKLGGDPGFQRVIKDMKDGLIREVRMQKNVK